MLSSGLTVIQCRSMPTSSTERHTHYSLVNDSNVTKANVGSLTFHLNEFLILNSLGVRYFNAVQNVLLSRLAAGSLGRRTTSTDDNGIVVISRQQGASDDYP